MFGCYFINVVFGPVAAIVQCTKMSSGVPDSATRRVLDVRFSLDATMVPKVVRPQRRDTTPANPFHETDVYKTVNKRLAMFSGARSVWRGRRARCSAGGELVCILGRRQGERTQPTPC